MTTRECERKHLAHGRRLESARVFETVVKDAVEAEEQEHVRIAVPENRKSGEEV